MQKKNRINILMLGSDLSVKGGMVSVIKNYLNYDHWTDFNVLFVPTHIESNIIYKNLYFMSSLVKIISKILFKEIDIVHMHVAERGSFFRKSIIVLICKSLNVKTVLHHHGAEFDLFYKQSSKRKQKFISYILETVDVNLVLSQKLITNITSKAPNSKVDFLYNGVNIEDSKLYNLNAKDILFLGRLGSRKGVYDLLEVIKMLDNNINTETKLYLCGDGDIEEVKNTIVNLGIEERVAHVGWISDTEKREIFHNIAINVLPSYNEGLPMTILETMAYGIPNISTKIASIPEVIEDGLNGYLINPGDKNGLREKISGMIDNVELRSSISTSAYNSISSKFSLESNVTKLKEIYKSIL